jgi:hypothetical protein
MRFPALSSRSQSSTFPAASHRSDKVELGRAQTPLDLGDTPMVSLVRESLRIPGQTELGVFTSMVEALEAACTH